MAFSLTMSLYCLALAITIPLRPAVAAGAPLQIALQSFPPGRGDPFSFQIVPSVLVYTAIFDSLTEFDSEGRLQPALATAWDRITPTRWRFTLRRNVTFSNGEAFDAAAVVAALDYLGTTEGRATRGALLFANVKSARADGPDAVVFDTGTADPILPRRMAAFRIPAPKKLAAVGMAQFARDPVGTGPFMVERWADAAIALSAAPQAWRKPVTPALNMRLIPEATSRLQALLSGAADIAYALDPDSESTLIGGGGRMIVEASASNMVIALRSNIDGPLRDVRVRRALNYAVNKQAMVDTLMGGRSVVASQPVPISVPGADQTLTPYEYAPDTAKRLLTEAGYPNGFKMTMELSSSSGSNSKAVFQMVAADFARVGIEATIRLLPNTETLRRILQGGWEGEAFEMTQDAMPMLDALSPFRYTSCNWPGQWYCDPAATPLVEAAERELNEAKRADMIRALLRRYRDDAPMIYLFRLANFTGLAANIDGYESPFGLVSYLHVHRVETKR